MDPRGLLDAFMLAFILIGIGIAAVIGGLAWLAWFLWRHIDIVWVP